MFYIQGCYEYDCHIQSECNTYEAKTLFTGDLQNELQKEYPIGFTRIVELTLQGKTEAIQLFSVEFNTQ